MNFISSPGPAQRALLELGSRQIYDQKDRLYIDQNCCLKFLACVEINYSPGSSQMAAPTLYSVT